MKSHDQEHQLRQIIRDRDITPVFQVIIDLFSGRVLGYEVLSRGRGELSSPMLMFDIARGCGLSWDLEQLCREQAFRKIATLPQELRELRYFVNVSPHILGDERFSSGFTKNLLRQYGLDADQIVFEITEEDSIGDFDRFEHLIKHYVHQGYRIAVDDFGSGHSGLTTLIAASPHYIKLDKAITRNLAESNYKQMLIKSITGLAMNLETEIIAEGVERWEEVEVLSRYGIRFAQGFLLQRPMLEPMPLSEPLRARLRDVSLRHNYARNELVPTIANLVVRPTVYEGDSMPCEQVEALFRKHSGLDHLVFVEGGRPIGLITRVWFYLQTGGPFGFSLSQRKPVRYLFKRDALIVEETMSIATMARMVMSRQRENLYDPALVIDAEGKFLGTVTMKQLIARATELEVQAAMGSNPLTKLQGNREIQRWIEELRTEDQFAIIYVDLDRFKEYNDVFGFMMGDDMLRLVAQVLQDHLHLAGEGARLGHIGGDDFIITLTNTDPKPYLERVCKDFDQEKRKLFDPQSLRNGSYKAITRAGVEAEVPLVTLSLATITSDRIGTGFHPGALGQIAASLKRLTKQHSAESGRSSYLFERRDLTTEAALAQLHA